MQYLYITLLIINTILLLGVSIHLFITRGPRKSFDQEITDMLEDGMKTYRR
jgi:hypothetical protein